MGKDEMETYQQGVPHRWLSVHDVMENNEKMQDALTVLYWAWVPDRSIYQDIMDEILDGVSAEVKLRIAAIIKVCKSKKLTDDGKQQKRRIMEKLFVHREITLVHVYICTCLCCPC